MTHVSKDFAMKHYADLSKKPFFGGLTDFLSSGPVVAMCWSGLDACKTGRKILGETNPKDSAAGSIRGDFAIDIGRNVCHESARNELGLWFGKDEICDWAPSSAPHVYEQGRT